MIYDTLRHFADSWGLVFMGVCYLIFVGWHFRPGASHRSRDAATVIFDEPQELTEADHG